MTASAPYATPWPDIFGFGLDPSVFLHQVRLHQAAALRRWSVAPEIAWKENAEAFVHDYQHWASTVPPVSAHGVLQDLLARALTNPAGTAAVPVLIGLGASLTEGHPDGDPTHHPMHSALQPADHRDRTLGTVLAHLPQRPFGDGQDPFPGWSRAQALAALYHHQFGQASRPLGDRLGLVPSPDEQAVLMAGWLTGQQRKRCTIAFQQWGWRPAPTPALMDVWWTTRQPDTHHPERPSAFDLAWAERFKNNLTFSPVQREMADTPVCAARKVYMDQVNQEFARWDAAMARSLQWSGLVPLSPDGRDQVLAEIVRMTASMEHVQRLAPATISEVDRHAREAAMLRHEVNVQAYTDAIHQGKTTALDKPPPRARL